MRRKWVTGKACVHVTRVATPWCRQVTPPSEPSSGPDPNPGHAPRGAARGPSPSVREPGSWQKQWPVSQEATLRARGREAVTSAGSQAAGARCRLLWASPLLPPGRPERSPARWPLPSAAASPLLIHKQPGLHWATRSQGPADPMAPSATPDSQPPCQPHLDLDYRSEVWISTRPGSRALPAAWQLSWSVDGSPGAADHLTHPPRWGKKAAEFSKLHLLPSSLWALPGPRQAPGTSSHPGGTGSGSPWGAWPGVGRRPCPASQTCPRLALHLPAAGPACRARAGRGTGRDGRGGEQRGLERGGVQWRFPRLGTALRPVQPAGMRGARISETPRESGTRGGQSSW